MNRPAIRTLLRLVLVVLLSASAAFAQAPASTPVMSARTQAQMDAVKQEAAARTPTQRKITWSLLYAAKEKATGRVAVAAAPKLRSRVNLESDGRVRVRIDAEVTPGLLAAIKTAGGTVTSSFPKYQAVYATLSLESLEAIAARPEVKFVGLPPAVMTNHEQAAFSLPQILAQPSAATTVNDPEGDVAHGAATVRSQYGATGAGLKIGVLSDSVDNAAGDYANAVLNGYVSAVTVVPGQAGSSATGEGEGLAMLEIVHRLAPNAQLYFASGDSGEEQMATNIGSLVSDGCNIIIDDISYGNESPFQEDTISTAVRAASDAGVLYFSSAANFGNLDSGTSSCWEGDFVGDSASPTLLDFEAGHSDSPQILNYVGTTSGASGLTVILFWSDPLGKAASSYYLYELDSSGNIVQEANDNSVNPVQTITNFAPGDYAGVQQHSGDPRFLHLDVVAQHSGFQYATSGRVRGHNACMAPNSFSIAATPAAAGVSGGPTGPYPSLFSSADMVEQFSDDGPRRIFYNPDGTAITPGNLSSTGGKLLAKPDFTAADGVSTSVGATGTGLNPFFGTSAAAPHAGALAALALSYNPALTPAQIGAALRSGTVQISAPGAGDRDAGTGILLAPNIIQAVSTPPSIISFSPANGPAGTIVTVTGINLGTTVSASINGVAAAFGVTSSNAVTVTVPAGATTGPVTILTAGGTATSASNFTLTASVSTPVVSSPTAATGKVGAAFAYQITATNSPTAFAAAGLPAGLTPSATGLISGVPTMAGTFPVTLTAANTAGGASSTVLTLTILPAPPAITSTSAASGQVGVAFAFQVSASNGPTGFSATGLPAGLVFNAATGLITGIPGAPGTFTVTVSATNAGGTSAATLVLTVLPAVPIISSVLAASGQQGVAFAYGITATNVPTVFGAAGLPAGLSINPATGVISGIPAVSGSYAVTIVAANAGGTGSAVLTLSFLIAPPVITSALVVDIVAEEHFTYQISGSEGPTSFAAAGLPRGLTVNAATGVISGVPTMAGHATVVISATNAGGTGSALLSLVVALPTVTIHALTPSIEATGGKAGEFILALSKVQTKPVTVAFTIEGSALNGTDYVRIKKIAVIKAGKTSQIIKIVPLDDFVGTKVVKLILKAGAAYKTHAPIHATVKIVGGE